MSWDFHVGALVVCVDDGPSIGDVPVDLVRGRIYTVAAISKDGLGIDVFEAPAVETELFDRFYWIYRFRPVKKTSIEVFERLLKPTEHEVAATTSSPVPLPLDLVDHRACQLADGPHAFRRPAAPPEGRMHLALGLAVNADDRAPSLFQVMSSVKWPLRCPYDSAKANPNAGQFNP